MPVFETSPTITASVWFALNAPVEVSLSAVGLGGAVTVGVIVELTVRSNFPGTSDTW